MHRSLGERVRRLLRGLLRGGGRSSEPAANLTFTPDAEQEHCSAIALL